MQEFRSKHRFHAKLPSWFCLNDPMQKHRSSRPACGHPSSLQLNLSPRPVNDPFLHIYRGPRNAIVPALPHGIGLPRSAEQPRNVPKFLAPLQHFRRKRKNEPQLKSNAPSKEVKAEKMREEEVRQYLQTPRFNSIDNIKIDTLHQEPERARDRPFRQIQMLFASQVDVTFRVKD